MAEGNDPHLMTASEFNGKVDSWGRKVKQQAGGRLSSLTKVYSGKLRGDLRNRVSRGSDDGIANWVGFRFVRYGVFVAYGVGRGWVRQGGTVVRARRVKYDSEEWKQHRRNGLSRNDIRQLAISINKGGKGRVPKDWLDGVIDSNIEDLANVAGEFYGDASMKHVLEEYDRLKIAK